MGPGPFPALLDLHGGAWNDKDRFANETMDRVLAASGVLVVAIDLTLAPEAPYPASVQDANYGVRWLKWKARDWGGDPSTVGILGSSTGGHLAELVAHAPARSALRRAPAAGGAHARRDRALRRHALADQRSLRALPSGGEDEARGHGAEHARCFEPWETIHEGNPQAMLERGEKVTLPPLLIMQGALDDNVLPQVQERFAAAYRKAGGDCRLEVFEGCEHLWIDTPGPQTDRAHAMVKDFIAEVLGSGPK